ncbi:hypothetical protein F66182_4569 [Fusarium sp. NRRL 66182]|nr:hypothetical protein F66182_4569 [Fusarium sp. NRRL 66182]
MASQVLRSYSTIETPLIPGQRVIWPPISVRWPVKQGLESYFAQLRVATVDGQVASENDILVDPCARRTTRVDKTCYFDFAPTLRDSAQGHWIGFEVTIYGREMVLVDKCCIEEAWVGEADYYMKLESNSQNLAYMSHGYSTPSTNSSDPSYEETNAGAASPPALHDSPGNALSGVELAPQQSSQTLPSASTSISFYTPLEYTISKEDDYLYGIGYILESGQVQCWNLYGPDISSTLRKLVTCTSSPFKRQVQHPQEYVSADGYKMSLTYFEAEQFMEQGIPGVITAPPAQKGPRVLWQLLKAESKKTKLFNAQQRSVIQDWILLQKPILWEQVKHHFPAHTYRVHHTDRGYLSWQNDTRGRDEDGSFAASAARESEIQSHQVQLDAFVI